MTIRNFLVPILISIGFLSSCSSPSIVNESAPEPIAVLPKSTPVLISPPPAHSVVIYQAYMEMQVDNVDRSVEEAVELTYQYGGYLASSQSWFVDNQKNTTITLAIPTVNFESLRNKLMRLGALVNEQISGERNPIDPGHGQIPYSHITIHLRPKPSRPPTIHLDIGWDPGRTVRAAWGVFLRIFGFIADIAIWITIVGGPFFLGFLVVRVLIRRLRNKPRMDVENMGIDHSLNEKVDSA